MTDGGSGDGNDKIVLSLDGWVHLGDNAQQHNTCRHGKKHIRLLTFVFISANYYISNI